MLKRKITTLAAVASQRRTRVVRQGRAHERGRASQRHDKIEILWVARRTKARGVTGAGLRETDNTTWQTDTGLLSPAGNAGGATGKPGVGDLVLWVEEVTNGGTLDLWCGVQYDTTA